MTIVFDVNGVSFRRAFGFAGMLTEDEGPPKHEVNTDAVGSMHEYEEDDEEPSHGV